jgi:RNA polymerase sigma-70 factor (ECF subfamily)
MEAPDKEFVYLLTDWQNRLFGYLVTLLGNVHDAHDVLQETNLLLWHKMDDFEADSDFGAWARKCAYFQALAFLRDRKRDRHLFDDELLAQFADEATDVEHEGSDRLLAMRDCLARLPDRHRQLIKLRYGQNQSVRQLAKDTGKKESALKMMLMRIRQTLHSCIELKLKETG